MADLLPSIPDASAPEDAQPRVVGLDDDEADDVLGALASTTARELFAALNDDPAHPSALADRVDTTLQNCQYHLEKLESAGLVTVVDTAYSEKGREMDVYAPADQPLVVFAGDEHDRSLLSRALGRLLGGLAVLAPGSLLAQGLFGGDQVVEESEPAATGAGMEAADDGDRGGVAADGDDEADYGADDGAGGGDDAATDSDGGVEEAPDVEADAPADESGASDPVVDAVDPVADELSWVGDLLSATGLEPGVALFVLGTLALSIGVFVWYRHQQPPTIEA